MIYKDIYIVSICIYHGTIIVRRLVIWVALDSRAPSPLNTLQECGRRVRGLGGEEGTVKGGVSAQPLAWPS